MEIKRKMQITIGIQNLCILGKHFINLQKTKTKIIAHNILLYKNIILYVKG